MREGLRTFSNVHFVERHNCYWGGFGHVEATLKGIRGLLERGTPFDYAVLLTGQDYPLKTTHAIEQFLVRNEGKSFIAYTALPDDEWDIMDRIERRYYRIGNTPIGLPLKVDGERFRRFAAIGRLLNLLLPAKRDFLPDMKPYAGSSYWNLSREAICYISDYVDHNPAFVTFFRNVFIPDELFFQTLLLNSPLKPGIVNDSLRHIDWSEKKNNPAILKEGDFKALCSSPKLFGRKFDPSVDRHILDMIDKHLLCE